MNDLIESPLWSTVMTFSTQEALRLLNNNQGCAYFVPDGFEPILIPRQQFLSNARTGLKAFAGPLPSSLPLNDCKIPSYIVNTRKVSTKGQQDWKDEGIPLSRNPPRPPNAFILYRKSKQADILAANQGLSNNDVSKIIGNMWQNEVESVKEHFQTSAHIIKLEHQIMYPNYRYSPRKSRAKDAQNISTKKCRASPLGVGAQEYSFSESSMSDKIQEFSSAITHESGTRQYEPLQSIYGIESTRFY